MIVQFRWCTYLLRSAIQTTRTSNSMIRFHKTSFALVLLIFSRLAIPTNSPLLAQSTDSTPESRTFSQTDRSGLKLALISPRIVVRKRARRLLLYSDKELVRTYRVGLGLSPVGDKVREGDRRTPEGDFYIFTKNSKSLSICRSV